MRSKRGKAPLILALFIVVYLAAGAVPRAASYAASFEDVAPDYWAAGYIDFASQKGIIEGYPNPGGAPVFAPENSVTMEEAAAMLYRALNAAGMLMSGEDFSAEYLQLFDDDKIAEWARVYVAYGLKYGVIQENDIGSFTDSEGRGVPAPRLTAAIWTAKAIGAGFTGAYSFPYTDISRIPAGALPYVDVLKRYGIMNGSLQPDGSVAFMPDAGIKRSEFAAIAGRVFDAAAGKVAGAFDPAIETVSFRGEITNIDEQARQVTLRAPSGAEQVIFVRAESQLVFNGKMVYNGFASIPKGQECVIAAMGMEPLSPTQTLFWSGPASLSGKITEITPLSGGCEKIGILDGEGNKVYYLKTIETSSDVSLSEGDEVNFIADGVKLIEII